MAITKDRFQNSDRKNQIYSDFLDDLNPHPVTGDIVRYVNENAVSRAIRNLILTNKGERLYQPNLGSDIFKMLFEPMSDAISQLLSSSIQDLIAAHEPRAKVISVDVAPDYEGNAYAVTLQYMIINRPTPVSLNVSLTRVR
jgi:phage baseplate assembly protein W